MADKEACAYCRFWSWDALGPDYTNQPTPGAMLGWMSGDCRRHAPAPAAERFDSTTSIARQWPITRGIERCGDFEHV